MKVNGKSCRRHKTVQFAIQPTAAAPLPRLGFPRNPPQIKGGTAKYLDELFLLGG